MGWKLQRRSRTRNGRARLGARSKRLAFIVALTVALAAPVGGRRGHDRAGVRCRGWRWTGRGQPISLGRARTIPPRCSSAGFPGCDRMRCPTCDHGARNDGEPRVCHRSGPAPEWRSCSTATRSPVPSPRGCMSSSPPTAGPTSTPVAGSARSRSSRQCTGPGKRFRGHGRQLRGWAVQNVPTDESARPHLDRRNSSGWTGRTAAPSA